MFLAAVETNPSQALGGLVGILLVIALLVILVTVIVKVTLRAMNRGKQKSD